MRRIIVASGDRYGRLTVIREVEKRNEHRIFLVQCDCTKIISVYLCNIRSGHTESCGCFGSLNTAEARLTHGLSKMPEYTLWHNMIRRCEGNSLRDKARYKNRGIAVCGPWQDLSVFVKWAQENGYRKGLELDRIDNRLGYSPDNCRFVSRRVNCSNTSLSYRWFIKGREFDSARKAAEFHGVGYSTIQCWVNGQRGKPGRTDCWREKLYPEESLKRKNS